MIRETNFLNLLDIDVHLWYNMIILKKGADTMTEQEAKMAQKVQLYDLRLIFTSGDKDTYTTQEIVELLDKIAMAKDQQ